MTAEFFLNSSGIKFENQLTSLNSFLGVDADYNYDYDYETEVPVEGDENVKGYINSKRIFSISSYEQKGWMCSVKFPGDMKFPVLFPQLSCLCLPEKLQEKPQKNSPNPWQGL